MNLLKHIFLRFKYRKKYKERPFFVIEFTSLKNHNGTFLMYHDNILLKNSKKVPYRMMCVANTVYDFKEGFIKCRSHYSDKSYLKYAYDFVEFTNKMREDENYIKNMNR